MNGSIRPFIGNSLRGSHVANELLYCEPSTSGSRRGICGGLQELILAVWAPAMGLIFGCYQIEE
jgi:hypothetical protein